ncbi:MAG: MlaC/ttg2D family ABC transporter substrate-binding protein [Gammaproteobacteria bacterium]
MTARAVARFLPRFLLRFAAFFAAACIAVFCAAAFASPEDVAKNLETRNDAVVRELKILRDSGALSDESTLALIQKEMSPIINFRNLAGQAAGKYWRRATDEEKTQITESFRGLLEKTYAKVLAKYGDEKVRITETKLRADGKTLVAVEISGGGKTAKVEYVFGETAESEMKITDIKVESISLLATYRRQFAGIAKKSGTAGLAEALQKLASR